MNNWNTQHHRKSQSWWQRHGIGTDLYTISECQFCISNINNQMREKQIHALLSKISARKFVKFKSTFCLPNTEVIFEEQYYIYLKIHYSLPFVVKICFYIKGKFFLQKTSKDRNLPRTSDKLCISQNDSNSPAHNEL